MVRHALVADVAINLHSALCCWGDLWNSHWCFVMLWIICGLLLCILLCFVASEFGSRLECWKDRI